MLSKPISDSPTQTDDVVGFTYVLGQPSPPKTGWHKIPGHNLTLKLMRGYRIALERAEKEIKKILVNHHLVPAYRGALHVAKFGAGWHYFRRGGKFMAFKVPRDKGDTDQLRNHVQVRFNLSNHKLFVRWTAPHAKYVSRQSPQFNPHIKQAITPATSLNWVKLLFPIIKMKLRAIWRTAMAQQGLHPRKLPVTGVIDAFMRDALWINLEVDF